MIETKKKFKFKCGCKFDSLNFDEINLDCPATWDLIGTGLTKGIFQLEGSLGKKYSKRLKPRNIEELSDVISLIRPGCLDAKFRENPEKPGKFLSITDTYEKVKSGEMEPEYLHEVLKPIFEDTCSVPVYQEQAMRICTDFAGFSLVEADFARKIIGKKKEDKVAELKGKFIEGATAQGHPLELSEFVFGWLKDFAGYLFNKCVARDTKLNRGGASKNSDGFQEIGHLYKLMNSIQYAKATGKISMRKKLMRSGYGKCMAMDADGRVRLRQIKTIHSNGVKDIYSVADSNGRKIKCTLDHKFMTPSGMKKIGDIDIGGVVVCHLNKYDNKYVYNYNMHNSTKRKTSVLVDSIGRHNGGFIDGNFSTFKKIKAKYDYIKSCAICDREPNRLEWHHIDGDRKNNIEINLKKLCVSCHKKEDYKLGRRSRFQKGHVTENTTITSIDYIGSEETYDVEMDTEEHTWVANGFVVSNSHGVSYAYIAYQTAYAKRHFPLQYFKAKLTHSEDKQDTKDEVQALVHEARLSGITISPPCLKLLNLNFAIQDNKTIAFGLVHIKGIGKTSVASLKRIAKFTNPNELLIKSFFKGSKVKKNVMEALIKSGALDYLGENRIELLVKYKILSALTERELKLLSETFLEKANGDILPGLRLLIASTEKGKKLTAPRVLKVHTLISSSIKDLGGNKKRLSIGYEKFYLGISLTGSELELYNNPEVGLRCRDMHRLKDGTKGGLAVIIEKVKTIKDRNGNYMCFLVVSDSTYMMDCVVFSSTYKNYSWIIEEGKAVLLIGRKDGESFIVNKIQHL